MATEAEMRRWPATLLVQVLGRDELDRAVAVAVSWAERRKPDPARRPAS